MAIDKVIRSRRREYFVTTASFIHVHVSFNGDQNLMLANQLKAKTKTTRDTTPQIPQNASILKNTYTLLAHRMKKKNVLTQRTPYAMLTSSTLNCTDARIKRMPFVMCLFQFTLALNATVRSYFSFSTRACDKHNYDVKWVEHKNTGKHIHPMVNEPLHISPFDKHQCILYRQCENEWKKNI